MRVTKTPAGMLVQANNEERGDLAGFLREGERGRAAMMLAEGLHEIAESLPPENIAALTDQPLFADWAHDDDGGLTVYGPVYGFPDYAVRDELEELAWKGRAFFPVVATFPDDGETFPCPYSDEGAALRLAAYEGCV